MLYDTRARSRSPPKYLTNIRRYFKATSMFKKGSSNASLVNDPSWVISLAVESFTCNNPYALFRLTAFGLPELSRQIIRFTML